MNRAFAVRLPQIDMAGTFAESGEGGGILFADEGGWRVVDQGGKEGVAAKFVNMVEGGFPDAVDSVGGRFGVPEGGKRWGMNHLDNYLSFWNSQMVSDLTASHRCHECDFSDR